MIKISRLVFFISCILVFSECKKGEGDPSVSLRSRKNRLTGEWRLKSGSASYTAEGYNESYTFDGSNLTGYVTAYPPVIYTGKYKVNLKINKDGTFAFNENFASAILEASGTWNFNTGVGDAKKKEEAVFLIDKVTKGYTNGNNLFNRGAVHFVYKITELRNKKLVINSTGKVYTNSAGKYVTLTTDYTFIQ